MDKLNVRPTHYLSFEIIWLLLSLYIAGKGLNDSCVLTVAVTVRRTVSGDVELRRDSALLCAGPCKQYLDRTNASYHYHAGPPACAPRILIAQTNLLFDSPVWQQ